MRNFRFSSVQFLDRLDRRGDTRYDSSEFLFQSFLREAIVSSSGMGRSVHSLMLSFQHFLCRPRRRPLCKVPSRLVLERLSYRCMTCPSHASVRLLTVAREFLWAHNGTDPAPDPVVGLVLQVGDTEECISSGTRSRKPGSFSQSQRGGSITTSRSMN